MRPFLDPLLEAVKEKNKDKAADWAHEEAWATVEQLIQAQGPSPDVIGPPSSGPFAPAPPSGSSGGAAAAVSGAMWACPHCTFLNQPELTTCEICGLPKS